MLLGALLALAALGGPTDPADPSSLVAGLGSPRYLERESAEAALTRLGRSALPALRAATEAKDPEVRVRASAILARIEGALLVEPTPIALDFTDVPLGEVIRSINRRSGLALRVASEDDPAAAPGRITLRADAPLPFWRGVDALCEAGGLHYAVGVPPAPGTRESAFPLYPGCSRRPEPVSDSGPFRTHLASVHYQSEIVMAPARPMPPSRGAGLRAVAEPDGPASARQFYLQFLMAAEPRLSITQNGAARIIEALDDQGRSLLVPANQATILRSSGYFGMNPSPVVRFRVDLNYPEAPGRKIGRLRGAMPIIVASRKPEPLKVPLAGGPGRRFRSPDVELTVGDVKAGRDGQPSTIALTVKPLGAASLKAPGADVDPLAARLESPLQQLEVLDQAGEPIAWFPSSSLFDGEETRLTLSLRPGGDSKPESIAYHGMIRAATEVPFEFRDVPIP